jgi:hypothetical protein
MSLKTREMPSAMQSNVTDFGWPNGLDTSFHRHNSFSLVRSFPLKSRQIADRRLLGAYTKGTESSNSSPSARQSELQRKPAELP